MNSSIGVSLIAPAGTAKQVNSKQDTTTTSEFFKNHFTAQTRNPQSPISITVDFSQRENARTSHAMLEFFLTTDADPVLDQVRQAKVTGYGSLGNWTLVAHAFERLSGLETIHWDSVMAIPADILHILEEKALKPQLYYTMDYENFDPFVTSPEMVGIVGVEWDHEIRALARESILNSTVLYSLKAHIMYGAITNFNDMDLIFRILASCPNLRELDLSLQYDGCVIGNAALAFDFLSLPDVRFPPLEVLKLDRYRFDEGPDGGYNFLRRPEKMPKIQNWFWQTVDRLIVRIFGDSPPPVTVDDVPNSSVDSTKSPTANDFEGKSNLECWMEVMDWSHLHSLCVNTYTMGERARDLMYQKLRGAALPNLKSLSFYGAREGDILDFISNTVLPLESLNIAKVDGLVDVVSARCQELKSLSVRGFLNETELTVMVQNCPKLEKLDFKVNRTVIISDSHPEDEILIILSKAPSLEHLILRYPSPDDSHVFLHELRHNLDNNYYYGTPFEDEVDPIVNGDSARTLWKYLCNNSRRVGLKTLEIYVGDWENRNVTGGLDSRERLRVGKYTCSEEGGQLNCEGSQMRNAP